MCLHFMRAYLGSVTKIHVCTFKLGMVGNEVCKKTYAAHVLSTDKTWVNIYKKCFI